MSSLKGKVGALEINWTKIPKGPLGQAHAELSSGEKVEVRWRRDAQGIWLELPHGVFGYDIVGEINDEGNRVYRVTRRGDAQQWSGLHFSRAGEDQALAASAGKKKGLRIRAQMPGKIVRILTQVGAQVEKDQPLFVMEAMKMENEIRAPQASKVAVIKVTEGQAVETGADLALLE